MQKWHINRDSRVEKCKAVFRSCPFEDYDTPGEAQQVISERSKAAWGNQIKKDIHNALQRRPQNYVMRISEIDNDDESYQKFGENMQNIIDSAASLKDLETITVVRKITDPNISRKDEYFEIRRLPKADYNKGRIVGKWELKDSKGDIITELDLDNNYQTEIKRIAPIIQKYAENNIKDLTKLNSTITNIKNQIEYFYASITEEIKGGSKASEIFAAQGIKQGVFSRSEGHRINIDVNYSNTSFRPEMIERYLDDEDLAKTTPPRLSLRITDNDNGLSASSWTLSYDDNGWIVQTKPKNGVPESRKFLPGEDAAIAHYIKRYTQKNMMKNREDIADSKAAWVKNTINNVDEIMKKHNKKYFSQKPTQNNISTINSIPNDSNSKENIYGRKETNGSTTMGNLLNMFS